MQFIDTFELRFPGLSHAEVAVRHPSSWRDVTLSTGNVSGVPAVEAFVDGSRWLARCPDPTCQGAERVSFDSAVFFCCECRNRAVGHDYLRVKLPSLKQRAAVERVLLKRPDWHVRAWRPGETVADLERENHEHGLTA